MNHPVLMWCAIAAVLLLAFVFRAVGKHHVLCRHRESKPRRFFEMGSEKDIFFIPGDCDDDDC